MAWRNSFAWMTVAAAVFAIRSAPAEERETTSAPPDSAICVLDEPRSTRFRAGDTITLTQYERVDPDQNDRMPAQNAYPNYRLRSEVSGDFNIAEDGTISVPILGQFKAAGMTVDALHDAISQAFESVLGHAGVITVSIAERQPVYVDGVVKMPGAYKYTSGLTVLHAVSLAGGFNDVKLESHQVLLQTVQEAVNGEQAKSRLERLLARLAVLQAALDSAPVSTPQALLDLASESHAKELVAAQVAERQTVVDTNAVLDRQQSQLIVSANQALDVRTNQLKEYDAEIEERAARLKTLQSMISKGLSNENFYETAQAEYMGALGRKQEAIAGIQLAQSQITDAQSRLAKLKLDAKFALQHEISDLELQIAQQWIVYRSHLTIASIVDPDPNAVPGAPPLVYELVRRTGGRAATYQVKGSCLLQPGDFVRVYLGSGKRPEDVVSKSGSRD